MSAETNRHTHTEHKKRPAHPGYLVLVGPEGHLHCPGMMYHDQFVEFTIECRWPHLPHPHSSELQTFLLFQSGPTSRFAQARMGQKLLRRKNAPLSIYTVLEKELKMD